MFSATLLKLASSAVAFNAQCDPTKDNPQSGFFSVPHWWKYLHSGVGDVLGSCTPTVDFSKGPIEILAIVLAIIDILLYVAGIVAVGAVIYAGILYITSAGNAEQATSARKHIQTALIGLAIVFIASAAVSFIGNSLT